MTSKEYDIEPVSTFVVAGCLIWCGLLLICASVVLIKLTMLVVGI